MPTSQMTWIARLLRFLAYLLDGEQPVSLEDGDLERMRTYEAPNVLPGRWTSTTQWLPKQVSSQYSPDWTPQPQPNPKAQGTAMPFRPPVLGVRPPPPASPQQIAYAKESPPMPSQRPVRPPPPPSWPQLSCYEEFPPMQSQPSSSSGPLMYRQMGPTVVAPQTNQIPSIIDFVKPMEGPCVPLPVMDFVQVTPTEVPFVPLPRMSGVPIITPPMREEELTPSPRELEAYAREHHERTGEMLPAMPSTTIPKNHARISISSPNRIVWITNGPNRTTWDVYHLYQNCFEMMEQNVPVAQTELRRAGNRSACRRCQLQEYSELNLRWMDQQTFWRWSVSWGCYLSFVDCLIHSGSAP